MSAYWDHIFSPYFQQRESYDISMFYLIYESIQTSDIADYVCTESICFLSYRKFLQKIENELFIIICFYFYQKG